MPEPSPPVGQVSFYSKIDKSLYFQTEDGNEYKILDSSQPISYEIEYITVTLLDFVNKSITLNATPNFPDRTLLTVEGGPPQFYNLDYAVVGSSVTWDLLGLDGLIEVGDIIQVIYV